MDPRQAEVLVQFSNLLSFLMKPDEAKKLVDEIKEWVEKQQALLGPLATKEAADKYMEDAKAKAALAEKAAAIANQQVVADLEKQKQALADSLAAAEKDRQAAYEMKLKQAEETTLASNMRADAEKKLSEAMVQVDAAAKRAMEIGVKERALEEKAERLQKLMAG